MRQLLVFVMVFLMGLACSTNSHAMTLHQQWALHYSYEVGFPYGNTIAAIVWQESSLCKYKIGQHHDYGCGQVQEGAVWEAWHMHISPYSLIHDDIMNIHVTAAYFNYCFNQTKSWSRAIICYNRGPAYANKITWAQVHKNKYLRHIRKRMGQVMAIENKI